MNWQEILVVNGQPYRFTEMQFYTCANCERATMTGLCGCPKPTPLPTHKLPFGIPIESSTS